MSCVATVRECKSRLGSRFANARKIRNTANSQGVREELEVVARVAIVEGTTPGAHRVVVWVDTTRRAVVGIAFETLVGIARERSAGRLASGRIEDGRHTTMFARAIRLVI